jgi:hypothetical protein
MNNAHFKLNTFVNHPNEAFHVARTAISSHDDLQLHNHGFAEVFLIHITGLSSFQQSE